MKVAVVAVTRQGAELGLKVAGVIRAAGHQATVLTAPDLAGKLCGTDAFEGTLGNAAGVLFSRYRALVMIMALGIAVRVIAPHVRDKATDPAVVVLDEGGNFAVSVLSGHLGGANDLARLIAAGIGCTAVITTATDVRGVPAVDVLARDLKLAPDPPGAVKKVNAALARGERVVIFTEYELPRIQTGPLEVRPWNEAGEADGGWRILVTGREPVAAGERDLLLRPRNLAVGVGCKRGKSCAEIVGEVKRTLEAAGRSPLCVMAVATVGARACEEGMAEAARELGSTLVGFAPAELNAAVERYGLQKSGRAMDMMGVGGVCEPAAMLACRRGSLLVPKRKGDGITVAVAEEESAWWESDPGRPT